MDDGPDRPGKVADRPSTASRKPVRCRHASTRAGAGTWPGPSFPASARRALPLGRRPGQLSGLYGLRCLLAWLGRKRVDDALSALSSCPALEGSGT